MSTTAPYACAVDDLAVLHFSDAPGAGLYRVARVHAVSQDGVMTEIQMCDNATPREVRAITGLGARMIMPARHVNIEAALCCARDAIEDYAPEARGWTDLTELRTMLRRFRRDAPTQAPPLTPFDTCAPSVAHGLDVLSGYVVTYTTSSSTRRDVFYTDDATDYNTALRVARGGRLRIRDGSIQAIWADVDHVHNGGACRHY